MEEFDMSRALDKDCIVIGPRHSGKTRLMNRMYRPLSGYVYTPQNEMQTRRVIETALKDKRKGNIQHRTIVMDNNSLAVSKCITLAKLACNARCYDTNFILSVGDIKGCAATVLRNADFVFFAGYDHRSITTFTELTGDKNTPMYCEQHLTQNHRFIVYDAANMKVYKLSEIK